MDVMIGVAKKVGGKPSRVFLLGQEKKRYFSWKWFVVLVVLALLIWGVWVFFFSYSVFTLLALSPYIASNQDLFQRAGAFQASSFRAE